MSFSLAFRVGKAVQNHFLNKLTPEEQWNMCVGAKNHASDLLDGIMEPNYDKDELKVRKFVVSPIDGPMEEYVGLKCPTIPRVVLIPAENSAEGIKLRIVTKKNEFAKEDFEVEIVDSVELLQGE